MAVTLGQQLEVYDFPAALLTLRHALAARQDAEPPPPSDTDH
jgi:hypothetical protein